MFNNALLRINKMIKMRKEALEFYCTIDNNRRSMMTYGPDPLVVIKEEEKVTYKQSVHSLLSAVLVQFM